jgi:hypothetical protein
MTLDTALPMRSSIDGSVNLCDSHFVTDSKRIPRPRDPNQLAKLVMDIATGEQDDRTKTDDGRDLAAVLLGRRGGLKGGVARAATLSSERRTEIARKAAAARWNKNGRD